MPALSSDDRDYKLDNAKQVNRLKRDGYDEQYGGGNSTEGEEVEVPGVDSDGEGGTQPNYLARSKSSNVSVLFDPDVESHVSPIEAPGAPTEGDVAWRVANLQFQKCLIATSQLTDTHWTVAVIPSLYAVSEYIIIHDHRHHPMKL